VSVTEQLSRHVPGCLVTGLAEVRLTNGCEARSLKLLQQLRGLETLGLQFVATKRGRRIRGDSDVDDDDDDDDGQQAAWDGGIVADRAAEEAAIAARLEAAHQQSVQLAAPLCGLSSSLRQLSVRGAPTSGWRATAAFDGVSDWHMWQRLAQQQAHTLGPALAELTSLTRLRIKEPRFQRMPGSCLSLAPLAPLSKLQELVLERQHMYGATELCPLSGLRSLRVLRFKVHPVTCYRAEWRHEWRSSRWAQQGLPQCCAGLCSSVCVACQHGSQGAGCCERQVTAAAC
jgi:hypothetical protein